MDFQRLLQHVDGRHFSATVHPEALVLVIRRVHELEHRLIAEQDAPPVQDGPVLPLPGKCQPIPLLGFGQFWLAAQFERFETQALGHVVVDSALRHWVTFFSQLFGLFPRRLATFQLGLGEHDFGHSAQHSLSPTTLAILQ